MHTPPADRAHSPLPLLCLPLCMTATTSSTPPHHPGNRQHKKNRSSRGAFLEKFCSRFNRDQKWSTTGRRRPQQQQHTHYLATPPPPSSSSR
uniref:Putative secreted protein n=1 Tax=Anopheles darlingi TaxID=43151 RepID=A0A2M4D8U2_ANODA